MAAKYKNTVHKNPFREDRPKPPFPWIAVTVAVLLVVAVVLGATVLYQYFGNSDSPRRFTEISPGAVVYDPLSELTYEYRLSGYQAAKLGGIYAECGDYTFYTIDGIDPEIMIYSSYDDIPYGIFCVADYEFPTLEEFEVSTGVIHEVELYSIPLGELDEESTKKAAEILITRDGVDYPSGIDNDSTLEIYFYSDKYPYLTYSVRYFRTNAGERYFADHPSKRYIKLESDELTDCFPVE